MAVEESITVVADVLSHKEYSLLATLLYEQFVRGELSEEDFAVGMYSLIAEDLYGDQWTFHPQAGGWFQIDKGEWSAGTPRGPLLVAVPEELSEALHAFSTKLQEIESRVPKRQAEAITCAQCGAQLRPDWRYCSVCGAEVEARQPAPDGEPTVTCPACSARVARSKFCGQCGARLSQE